jgi:hypothetical protein
MTYAAGTAVTEPESRAQVQALLLAHRATQVEVGANAAGDAVVKFTLRRQVRMLVPMPAGRERQRRWRVVLLLLKAKLEAVSSGLSTFDDEFLAHIVAANGETVGRMVLPMLAGRTA